MKSDKEKIEILLSLLFESFYGHLKGGPVLTEIEYYEIKKQLIHSGVFEFQCLEYNQLVIRQ